MKVGQFEATGSALRRFRFRLLYQPDDVSNLPKSIGNTSGQRDGLAASLLRHSERSVIREVVPSDEGLMVRRALERRLAER